MGLFDGLIRGRNEAKTIAEEKKVEEKTIEAEEIVEEPIEELPEEPAEEPAVEAPSPEEETPAPSSRQFKTYDQKKPVTHVVGHTHVLALINQKGGVGKSTTAIDLGAALGEMNKQVLLVDFDPQGNTTSGLGVNKNELESCIYDVLLNDVPITDIIIPDIFEGLDLVPASMNLAGAELELATQMARENRLKEAIGPFLGKYDYIFIDCPPSLGLLTVNALVAADKLLVPIQCEYYAMEGVTKLLETMNTVKKRLNSSLEIFGVLLTMYDGRTILSRQVAEEVKNYFGKLAFETMIPRSVKLSEAPSFGLPITQYDPSGKGAKAYIELAKEVISRG